MPEIKNNEIMRFPNNPVLTPDVTHPWESKAVLNPAAIDLDGKVYILYRAMSDDNTSTIGLAVSSDGLHIDERLPKPIYVPREPFEKKTVPGGNSGCEDPRIVRIDDRLYMTYTAYDGLQPGVAVTSISVNDFLSRTWNWAKPFMVTPPGIDDKDGGLFPEKINGKYMILHRVGLNICAETLSTLDFSIEKITRCTEVMKPRPGMWDGKKIGIAAPPIRTDKGWLLTYHGISDQTVYSVGAVLLDLENPTKVISRLKDPLLYPEVDCEIAGQMKTVVFPCGAIVRDDRLFIYYGGADSVVAIATTSLSGLLKKLEAHREA